MIDYEKEQQAAELKGSLLKFCQFFFQHLTNRQFIISSPAGRESHQITVARALTQVSRLEIPSQRLIINIPPGHGKSVFCSMWTAWNLAQYPDCNFLYISYSHDLAAKHTAFIKQIMSSRMYKYLFDVHISTDSRAKDSFKTIQGGSVAAFGSAGAITGQDGGLPGLERFSGAVIIDDPIKPDAAHSDTIRATVIRNYEETIRQRVRGINVPIIFIGQRLHEDDLAAFLLDDKDIVKWDSVVLQSIDSAGNALYPEINPLQQLRELERLSPYVFASQFQQNPLPAGGGLFKPEWFEIMDFEPGNIQKTFITADTAETDKSYNDATVFSFWGIYEIETFGRKTGELGLHWLDCMELRIEPKDLKDAFLDFWQDCMRHKIAPLIAAIEKKSTGVTLLSVLKDIRGIQTRDIERHAGSGSKTERFIQIQSHIASKKISFTRDAKHVENCIKHMSKITANNTHRHDDIADTCADAVKIALIDKLLQTNQAKNDNISSKLFAHEQSLLKAQGAAYYGEREY